METHVVDMATKRSWPVWKIENWLTTVQWLGDEQLLIYRDDWRQVGNERVPVDHSLWVVNRDGTSKRKVLP